MLCTTRGEGVEKTLSNNLIGLWNQTIEPLERRLGSEEFDTWIKPMTPLAQGDGFVEVGVPNRLFASWVEENFLDALASAWLAAAGSRASFRFRWDPTPSQGELFSPGEVQGPRDNTADRSPEPAHTQTPAEQRAAASGGLISRYDFASFVVGQSNQFARAAAIAVAGQPGALYNPYFLFGGVGLGKTHLVNAIGNSVLRENPSARVLFLSADTFTNRFIDAISRNQVQAFKNRMRRIDVLILDDVQFLAGRERTQEECFHLFNTLYENGKQIVLTSDKFPNEIQGVEERLCNRFGWGLVADIMPPDIETRMAILERRARGEGIDLPIDVASFIATRVDSNIRDLEGALTRLSAFASLNRCELSLELAEHMLGHVGTRSESGPSLDEIEARVVTHFGLKPGELRARKRTRKVAEARHVAMYIMRNHAGASFPTIGQQLGGRDHSTVVHGCQAVKKRCAEDPKFRGLVETLVRILGCG